MCMFVLFSLCVSRSILMHLCDSWSQNFFLLFFFSYFKYFKLIVYLFSLKKTYIYSYDRAFSNHLRSFLLVHLVFLDYRESFG